MAQLREVHNLEQQRRTRETQLGGLYQKFHTAIQQEAWEDAIQIGRRIWQSAPDYADVARLLSLAQKKRQEAEAVEAATKARQQKEARLKPLHAQLQAAVTRQDWPEVLRIGGQIQALQPDDSTAAQWIAHALEKVRRPAQTSPPGPTRVPKPARQR